MSEKKINSLLCIKMTDYISPTLVEEEEGLAWWWRVAGTVAERERDTVQSEGRLAGGEMRRWQHNDGRRTRLAWWCRQKLQREMEETARARKKKRGSHFCALIKLYGLGRFN